MCIYILCVCVTRDAATKGPSTRVTQEVPVSMVIIMVMLASFAAVAAVAAVIYYC